MKSSYSDFAKHWWHCVNCASVNNWFLCSWSRWFIKVKNQAANGHKQSDSSIIPRECLSCWDYPLSAERVEAIKIVWVNSLSEQLKVSVAVSYSQQTCPEHPISWPNQQCKPIQCVKGIFWFQRFKLSWIDSIFGILLITTKNVFPLVPTNLGYSEALMV